MCVCVCVGSSLHSGRIERSEFGIRLGLCVCVYVREYELCLANIFGVDDLGAESSGV